jgi:hypothetical protein
VTELGGEHQRPVPILGAGGPEEPASLGEPPQPRGRGRVATRAPRRTRASAASRKPKARALIRGEVHGPEPCASTAATAAGSEA